ncbi:MAG: NAD(P)-binding domain-containing protein, partial [Succinivibrio sp.]|nr:NAD(P)-binding domain-containing protein [Succinivibrio sp.]
MGSFKSVLGVIGAGSYGTALAQSTASKGLPVMLWCRNPETAKLLQSSRENSKYLPGIRFEDTLTVTSSLEEVMANCRDILVVVPSHTFADVLTKIKQYLTPNHRIAWATKGMDLNTGKLLSEVATDVLGSDVPMAALSGPTFAVELAKGLPTAIAVAGTNSDFIKDF